jgi:hypothetical protein
MAATRQGDGSERQVKEDIPVNLIHQPPSLPSLTPKSGVPDFGVLKLAKVENIRLWCNPSLSRRMMDHQNSGVPEFWQFRWTQIGNIRFAVVKPAGDG